MKRKRMSALDRAAAIAGSWANLANFIGVSPQAISQWKRVPSARVIAVERATGVSRHDLRPDLYPREEPAPIRSEQPTV
jgi:DNA-binding transcriptional regulator YdaS (Cro superfamily)